jgi:hypothetical protein
MGGRFGGSLHPRAESSPRLSPFVVSTGSQRSLIHAVPAQDVMAPPLSLISTSSASRLNAVTTEAVERGIVAGIHWPAALRREATRSSLDKHGMF